MITQDQLAGSILDFSFILIFCLIGSITKDAYNTMVNKDCKIKATRILLSTIVSSLLIFSLSDYLLSKISWKLFILPCFVSGMVGFEILGKMSKIGFWLKVIKDINNKDELIKDLSSLDEEKDDKGKGG